MKDSPSHRVDLEATPSTGIALTSLNPIKTSLRASRANKALTIAIIEDIIQARIVCRKLFIKVLNCVVHKYPLFNGIYSINCLLPAVKG